MANENLRKYVGGRSCAILGIGVSNLPLAEALFEMGIRLCVYDKKSVSELGARAEVLAARGVRFVCGANCFETVEGELIFRSPGIRPDLPALTAAKARGAEVTSEMELFLLLTEADTYGITGSDGKTTSTTLTGEFLRAGAAGKTFVGGNIGTPLLTLGDEITADDQAVVELSSFQLMGVTRSVRSAAVTNLSPNHLDWHTDMAEYEAAKRCILREETVRFVTNAESDATARMAREEIAKGEREVILFSSRCRHFSEFSDFGKPEYNRFLAVYERDGVILLSDGKEEVPLLKTECIRVPGRHNVENFMTAMALTYGKVDLSVYERVACSFGGVEHRLELVRTLDGVDYYNSSIDSSPSRTAAALSALAGRDIVVICGGYDKKISFDPLARSLCASVRSVVLTGATKELIREAIERCPDYDENALQVLTEADFAAAVALARRVARRGGCVLLSPACASFDAFRNFHERGNVFKSIVRAFDESKDTKC